MEISWRSLGDLIKIYIGDFKKILNISKNKLYFYKWRSHGYLIENSLRF